MSVACAVPDSILKNPARLGYSWNAKGSVEELVDNVRGFPEWLGRTNVEIAACLKLSSFKSAIRSPCPLMLRVGPF